MAKKKEQLDVFTLQQSLNRFQQAFQQAKKAKNLNLQYRIEKQRADLILKMKMLQVKNPTINQQADPLFIIKQIAILYPQLKDYKLILKNAALEIAKYRQSQQDVK